MTSMSLTTSLVLRCMRSSTSSSHNLRYLSSLTTPTNYSSSIESTCYSHRVTQTHTSHRRLYSTPRLVEVGVLENPKQGKYESGQMFLHQVFGYRGVILHPWVAKVYDKDDTSLAYPTGRHGKDVVGKDKIYYLTLIDNRDTKHLIPQMPDSEESSYPIPGLDYVSHEDVVPYFSSEPVHHDFFSTFFSYDSNSSPSWIGEEALRNWLSKHEPLLEMTEVHRQTTDNIRITVMPFYRGIRESQRNQVYWWRYSIRLENLGKEKVQLRERHWRIFSLTGTLETVRGRGVVGKEPVLTVENSAFQYSSHVSLQAASGHMWGTFKMEREDGSSFECKIPPFSLESKVEE